MSTQTSQLGPSIESSTAAASSSPSIHKNWIVGILALVMFTHIMDFMVLMPLGPKLFSIFGITPQQFSFLVSSYSFAAGICGLLGAVFFDRVDRKHALVGSYIGFLIGTISCAFAPTFTILLIARSITGAFGGLLSGIGFAIIGDIFSVQERGAAMGKLMSSFSFAAVIGVPFGLIIAEAFGWHMTFIAIGVMGMIGLGLILKFIPNFRFHLQTEEGAKEGIFSSLIENLFDPNSQIALVTTFTMVLSQFVVVPFISTFLVANAAFPEKDLPLLYLLGGLFTVFSGPYVGKLCDHFSARKIYTYTGLLFLIPVFFVTHLGPSPVWFSLIFTTLFFAFSNARMIPAMTIIAGSIPPNRRGSFMSLNACLQQIGAASASALGGLVVTQAGAGVPFSGFENTAYISAVFGIIAYFVGKRIRSIS